MGYCWVRGDGLQEWDHHQATEYLLNTNTIPTSGELEGHESVSPPALLPWLPPSIEELPTSSAEAGEGPLCLFECCEGVTCPVW